ncbi:MAG: ABC transporter substrate-binding protein [Proteobacteria bacterium]|nr:ABC transporter substrate-binding protein [Pseudomonadota bacterium]MBI3497535.1 ABC transporter substrate-binding protein [Pseudomonadota bacterium]
MPARPTRPTRPTRFQPTRRAFSAGAVAALALQGVPFRPARAQAPVLKVGVLLPRSGFLAQAGQSCQRGAEIAPGVLADMGYRVEVASVDFESNVDIARTQAEKLVNDGAKVLVGAFDSGASGAIAQAAEQHGVPFVINVAADPKITDQGYKFTFRNFPTSPTLIRNGLNLMKDLFQATGKTPKSAVYIHANDTFGQANRAAIDRLFPTLSMPFPIVETIAYDPKAQDLSVEIAKAKASGAELVMVTTRAGDAIRLIREMVKQRYEPMGIVSPGSPGMYDDEFYQALGGYANFCVSNVPWPSATAAMTKAVEAAFKKAFPKNRFETDAFNVGFTFEAILIAAEAQKRAGSTDPKAIAEALRQTNIADHMLVGGPIRFDEKGQNNAIGSAAVQNHALTPTVVLPKEAAVRAPVFPMPGWRERG